MSISVKLIFQIYTELELLKVAAGAIDPTPTLLGLISNMRMHDAHPVQKSVFHIQFQWNCRREKRLLNLQLSFGGRRRELVELVHQSSDQLPHHRSQRNLLDIH